MNEKQSLKILADTVALLLGDRVATQETLIGVMKQLVGMRDEMAARMRVSIGLATIIARVDDPDQRRALIEQSLSSVETSSAELHLDRWIARLESGNDALAAHTRQFQEALTGLFGDD